MSRPGLVAATLLAALACSGAAQATLAPAPALKPLRLEALRRTDRVALSCSAHGRRLKGTAAKVERKLAPVACEQPPRSKALDGNFVLAP